MIARAHQESPEDRPRQRSRHSRSSCRSPSFRSAPTPGDGRRSLRGRFGVWTILGAIALQWVAGAASDLWEVGRLIQPPTVWWGARTGLTQEVYYEGEPYGGRPTRVFGYFGRPEATRGPFPAMLLVHGGGGRAFRDWADHWARRGYVALAMDLAGNGPTGRLADGGPGQDDVAKFRAFPDSEVREMWTYQAIAAVLRGHGLLRAQPEVNTRQIGVTGISWGGYLTCILAGVDPWLTVAVPVYGCGFLHESSVWRESRFERMSPEQRARWVRWFDPSQYLANARCRILFLNGATDFAYPLDSYRKSFELVPGPKALSVVPDLPHGHIWTFPEVDAFVDAAMGRGAPFPRLDPQTPPAGMLRARVSDARNPVRAWLRFTTDSGPWPRRQWKSVPASIRGRRIEADLPAERPLVAFLAIEDGRGLRVSAPHVELPAASEPP